MYSNTVSPRSVAMSSVATIHEISYDLQITSGRMEPIFQSFHVLLRHSSENITFGEAEPHQ